MRRIAGSPILWLALIAALAAGIWQLSASEHTQAFQLGVVVNANQLLADHDMDFETVFPGESIQGNLTVSLAGTTVDMSMVPWSGSYTEGNYTVTLLLNGSLEDMRPYLTVEKDPGEGETEPDPLASDPPAYQGEGTLSLGSGDTQDVWLVTFNVPGGAVVEGGVDYGALIEIAMLEPE